MTDTLIAELVLQLPNIAGLLIALFVLYKYCKNSDDK